MKIPDTTSPVIRLGAALVAAVGLIAIGLAIGWYLYRPAPPRPEPPAAAQRQADGSLVLPRTAQQPAAKPQHQTPPGAKVERIVNVKVKPRTFKAPVVKNKVTTDAAGNQSLEVQPPPVNVDLSLVRMPDKTRRVVASSPDGEVVGGLDIPAEPLPQVDDKKWAAGISYSPQDRTAGIWLDRDFGPFRGGVELNQVQRPQGGGTKFEARVKIGIRF